MEKLERILKDLCDVVDALNCGRCHDPIFQQKWIAKKSLVEKSILSLNESEYKILEKEYCNWFQTKYNKKITNMKGTNHESPDSL